MLLLNDSDNCQLVERVLHCNVDSPKQRKRLEPAQSSSHEQLILTTLILSVAVIYGQIYLDFEQIRKIRKINICTNRRGLLSVKGFPFYCQSYF